MRTTRRQPAEEPEPERPDPVARAGQLMDAHEALAAEVRAALSCPQSRQAVDRLADELNMLARHTGEVRAVLEQVAVTAPALKVAFEAGFEAGRAPQAAAAETPGPKHAASGKHLRLLPGVAAVGACLRHGWVAQHVPQLASGAAVVTLAASAALPPSAPVQHHHAPLAHAAVPGWRTPARHLRPPEASPRVRGPRPAAVRSTPLVTASPSSLPPSVATPPPASPSPSVVPGVLAADTSVVALRDGAMSAEVVITAEGGPVRWTVAEVPGVVVTPEGGELEAGESVTLTVSVADLSHSGFGIVQIGSLPVTVSWEAVPGLLGVAQLL